MATGIPPAESVVGGSHLERDKTSISSAGQKDGSPASLPTTLPIEATGPAPEINIELTVPTPQIHPIVSANLKPQTAQAHEDKLVTHPADATVGATTPGKAANSTDAGFHFLEADFPPGELRQTTWSAGESLHGAKISTPVLIARGTKEGPTLCVTAAVHGDELNGIESVRRLMYSIKPENLSGTVIGVPIVNLQGFQRHSRYLPDRRDLNRFFPGRPKGSAAARMAFSFFHDVVQHCDGLVDLHTGSFHRTNLPQLRADLNNKEVVALTKGFGSTVILHSTGASGTLRRAAVDAGVPAVTLEAGEPLRVQEKAVKHTVKALFTLLDTLHMYNKRSLWGNPEPTYYSAEWVRADKGGILFSSVKLGRRVKQGDLLGKVTDPITNEQVEIHAPHSGRVIGLALNQFVMPGFATFHLARSHHGKNDAAEALDPDADPAADPSGGHYDSNENSNPLDVAAAEPLSGDES